MSKPARSFQGDQPARWRDRPDAGEDSAPIPNSTAAGANAGAAGDAFLIAGQARWIRAFLAKHALAPEDLLDLGCGAGLIHEHLRGVAGRIHGLDVSADATAQARNARPAVDYAVYDGLNLPSPAESHDFVLAIAAMHRLPPKQWRSFMAEARRVLRPGGALIVIEHNPFDPLRRAAGRQTTFDGKANPLRAGKVVGLMRTAGFKECGRDYLFIIPVRSESLLGLEQRLAWLPLGAQYAAWGFKR